MLRLLVLCLVFDLGHHNSYRTKLYARLFKCGLAVLAERSACGFAIAELAPVSKAVYQMTSDLAIGFGITIGIVVVLVALVIALATIHRYYFGLRCPSCSGRQFNSISTRVFSTPAPRWSLYRCDHCGEEYIGDSNVLTSRADWTGDPDAENLFRELIADSTDTECDRRT